MLPGIRSLSLVLRQMCTTAYDASNSESSVVHIWRSTRDSDLIPGSIVHATRRAYCNFTNRRKSATCASGQTVVIRSDHLRSAAVEHWALRPGTILLSNVGFSEIEGAVPTALGIIIPVTV